MALKIEEVAIRNPIVKKNKFDFKFPICYIREYSYGS